MGDLIAFRLDLDKDLVVQLIHLWRVMRPYIFFGGGNMIVETVTQLFFGRVGLMRGRSVVLVVVSKAPLQ